MPVWYGTQSLVIVRWLQHLPAHFPPSFPDSDDSHLFGIDPVHTSGYLERDRARREAGKALLLCTSAMLGLEEIDLRVHVLHPAFKLRHLKPSRLKALAAQHAIATATNTSQ